MTVRSRALKGVSKPGVSTWVTLLSSSIPTKAECSSAAKVLFKFYFVLLLLTSWVWVPLVLKFRSIMLCQHTWSEPCTCLNPPETAHASTLRDWTTEIGTRLVVKLEHAEASVASPSVVSRPQCHYPDYGFDVQKFFNKLELDNNVYLPRRSDGCLDAPVCASTERLSKDCEAYLAMVPEFMSRLTRAVAHADPRSALAVAQLACCASQVGVQDQDGGVPCRSQHQPIASRRVPVGAGQEVWCTHLKPRATASLDVSLKYVEMTYEHRLRCASGGRAYDDSWSDRNCV